MAPQKACKQCKSIVTEGTKCSKCGSEEIAENSKGKIVVLNPDQSEVSKNLKIKDKGAYAIKLG